MPWALSRRYGQVPSAVPLPGPGPAEPPPPLVLSRSRQRRAAIGCDHPQADGDGFSAPLLSTVQQAHRLRGLWSAEALGHRLGQEDGGGNSGSGRHGLLAGYWGSGDTQKNSGTLVLAQGHRAGVARQGVFTCGPMGPFPLRDPSMQVLL